MQFQSILVQNLIVRVMGHLKMYTPATILVSKIEYFLLLTDEIVEKKFCKCLSIVRKSFEVNRRSLEAENNYEI